MAKSNCAACEQPITRGQEVATAWTEVFHRACIGNACDSVRTRLERDKRTLTAEMNRLHARLSFEEARSQRTASALAATEAEMVTQREQLRIFSAELMDGSAESAQLRRDLERAHRERDAANARAVSAEGLLDELRNRLSGPQPIPQTTSPDEKQDANAKDDSEIHFGLIDLD